jgi:hypothetical protein
MKLNRIVLMGLSLVGSSLFCVAEEATTTSGSTSPSGESGKVSSADRESKVIKIVNSSNQEKTFTISSNTKITVNGQDGKIDDLGPGMEATITTGDYPSIAQTITATGTSPDGKQYDYRKKASNNTTSAKKGKKKKK